MNTMRSPKSATQGFLIGMLLVMAAATPAFAQVAIPAESKCQPVAQRTQARGCWILIDQPVGPLSPGRTFWRIDSFATRAAAGAAKDAHSTVVEALQRFWVMAIA